ncbi:DUF2243 domain-containing protein [Vreelandella zhanjiangensis]|uniref:DUF2243 domain-containing protein n=1 Tax=Vreelandella zhanjiangensis TaxID=1121960 RepID=UPI00402AF1D3
MANHFPSSGFDTKRSLWAAVLLGIGVMAAVDEIVFHQLLQWHHFFDFGTPTFGIISDGLLHAFELLAIVIGVFMLLDLSQRKRLTIPWAKAGFFLGMGGFQLFDGLINHKILRLHQIRYGVDPLLYDVVWNGAAIVLLLAGFWFYRRAKRLGHR